MGARPQKEVYVRREHDPGQECEFDWEEIPLVIGVTPFQTVQMARVHLLGIPIRCSAWLFRSQDTLSLMEAHRNFFAEIQGGPQTMCNDNMKVAVTIRTFVVRAVRRQVPTKACSVFPCI